MDPPTTTTAGLPSPRLAHASTNNNDAPFALHPPTHKRLSLHAAAANTPLPLSPGASSDLLRSPSVMSVRRSESPALGRKPSNGSLRHTPPSLSLTPRRMSFNPNMPSSPLAQYEEERKPPPRACDIAEECFRQELALHNASAGAPSAGTVVIIHDQCYGHRFARPKTNKSTLSQIMERPERMLASVRGIAAAYVRLGERHCDGSNPLRPNQAPPERVPFKIHKTSRAVDLTSPVVTNVHGMAWMNELKGLCNNAGAKLASTGKELVRDPPTLPGQPPRQAFHPLDLYLSSESLNALQGALGGVLDAVDAVFQDSDKDNGISRAFVCVRPPAHHCSADWPSGFCWLNNVHVGIEHAIANYGLTHAAIIDFDLHHGDGSQEITWDRNEKVRGMHKNTPNWKKTSIGYFSLHDINSFPCEDGDREKVQAASLCIDNAHGQSIWNIHLETWATADEFWRIYEEKYLKLLDKARDYLKFHTSRLNKSASLPTPKAAIFLSAGFDASEWETGGMQRHKVNVPTEFYARFTRDVVRIAHEEGTGVHGRVISVLEGGYSDRALSSGVMSHLSGLCDGQVWTERKPAASNLADDLHQRMNGLSMQNGASRPTFSEPTLTPVVYDTLWWHESRLAELEQLVTPAPAIIPKKGRGGPAAHFSSPTQSFTAKVADPSKIQRSLSERYPASPSRLPTPPPPEVDWATASHALGRLLIPSDRQTTSHQPEELAEPKVKKEKPAPTLASVHVDPSGRQLRGRKPVTSYADIISDDELPSVRAESRASRRQTIADFPLATAEPPEPKREVSRRMSIASSVGSVSGSGDRGMERSVSRASSVLPGRRSATPGPGASAVQVKKGRTTSAAAKPPVPRIPSNYMSKTSAFKEKEKENEMDQLTSRVQRVKLNMPSKEEHDAKEKLKEAERKAKATRKAPAARTAKPAAKKGPGRPAKVPKAPSPSPPEVFGTAPPVPDVPEREVTAVAPLEQPRPVPVDQQPTVIAQLDGVSDIVSPIVPKSSSSGSRHSLGVLEPPTELIDMQLTPEQLPNPPFVEEELAALTLVASPQHPDTPPPPPPSVIPQVNSGTAQPAMSQLPSASEQLPAKPEHTFNLPASSPMPLSPPSHRRDLPVFSASGVIPFAPTAGVASHSSNAHSASSAPRQEPSDIWEIPDTPAR